MLDRLAMLLALAAGGNRMTTTQEQLLSLLSHVLFNSPTTTTITPEIETEAQLQAVSTLITTDYRTLGSNIRVFNAHAELTKILRCIWKTM